MSYTKSFLIWLQGKTGGNSTAQIRGESLFLAPDTADCFRATITALRSIQKDRVYLFTPTPYTKTGREDFREGFKQKDTRVRSERRTGRSRHLSSVRTLTPLEMPSSGRCKEQVSHSSLHCDGGKRVNGEQGTSSHQSMLYWHNGRDMQCKNCQRFGHSMQLWLPC